MDEETLAELLGDAPAPETPPQVVEDAAPEQEPTQAPEQEAEPAKTEDAKAEPPAHEPPQHEPKAVPLAALQEERSKRQDLERRLRELQTAKAKEPEPDFFENPDAWVQRQKQSFEEARIQDRMAISEEMLVMSVGKEKYDTAIAAFETAVSENPALAAQLRASSNPAKFAYDYGNKSLLMKEIGDDPLTYRERLKAEIMAEITAATAANAQTAEAQPKPTSLAGAKSESGLKTPAWNGPASLDDLLPN